MKKRLVGMLTVLLIAALALCITACGSKKEEEKDSGKSEPQTEVQTETKQEDAPEVVTSIDGIDEGDTPDLPLQISSITLFDDGSVKLIPLDDLRKNAEDNNELTDDAMYPFKEIGKVKEIYLVRFGNGGYRTVIALMEDGSLSAMSARELIEDHIIVVMPNVSGRDNYVSVEQVENEDSYSVNGVTEDGEEIELDFSLNF